MAALADRYADALPRETLIDLREVSADQLSPLLDDEVAAWRTQLNWDFSPSADLVRRFVQMRALNGLALMREGAIFGFFYYAAKEGKGLIGDFYVPPPHSTVEIENQLLEGVLQAMWRTPG